MAEKNSNNKKNNNSPKKQNNNSKKNTAKKPNKNQIDQKNQFWAVMLFALGILLFLVATVEGSDGWKVMHQVVRGIFGISSFVVPVIVSFIAVLLAQNKSHQLIVRRLCESLLGLLIVSGAIEIFFFPEIKGNTLSASIQYIYNDSINLKGGGVVGSLIGLSLLSVLGNVGSKIVMAIAILVILMLLTNTSLLGAIDIIKLPFIKVREVFSSLNFMETPEEDVVPEDLGVQEKPKKKPTLNLKKDTAKPKDVEPNSKDDTKKGEEEREDVLSSISDIVSKTIEKAKQTIDNALFEYVEEDEEEESTPEEDAITNTGDEELDTIFNDYSSNGDDTSNDDEDIDVSIEDAESVPVEQAPLTEPTTEENPLDNVTEDIQLELKDTLVDTPPKPKSTNKKYHYRKPPTTLLEKGKDNSASKVSKEELETTAKKLIETLESFQAKANIVGISRGPAVTRYEVQPYAGIKVSKITNLADDIALNLATSGVRMEAPIPGKSAIGVEVPNKVTDVVSIRELIESEKFKESCKKSKLSFVVGKDIAGNVIVGDIAKMPHVIIAGATGSGKSVCTNSIIMSILYNATPEEVKFILIDPKIVEFQHYSGIPHLLIPVVTDPKKSAGALNWAVQEMLRRYQTFADNKVKDLSGYNQRVEETGIGEKMPQIVIAIDELADLMMVAKGDVEEAICRLAQMARAAGMHLIIATQRPTVDIITGLIKANIPSRIALSVMSAIDSRTVIDTNGAEKLLGRGDMLYFPTGMPKPLRVQGCWVSPKDIEATVNYVKQDFEATYSDDILQEIEKSVPIEKSSKSSYNSSDEVIPNSDEDLIERAIDMIMESGQASTSMIQRRLKLGYARAGRIMDELEEMGIVGASQGSKPREILLTKSQWTERKVNGKQG